LENPARDYLSALIIRATAPDALDLRNGGSKVVIVLSTPKGSDALHVVQFNRADLQSSNAEPGW
jgi:hypothetical protein